MLTSLSLFCSSRTGLHSCHRIAWHRCAGCSRPLCHQHAIRLKLISGDRWICADCQRRNFPFGKYRV